MPGTTLASHEMTIEEYLDLEKTTPMANELLASSARSRHRRQA